MSQMTCFQLIQVIDNWFSVRNIGKILKGQPEAVTNDNLQNTTEKTIDSATRTPLKPGMKSGAPEE